MRDHAAAPPRRRARPTARTRDTTPAMTDPLESTVHAPEFREGLDWINTGGAPLRLADLRGRIVLLDFWTYG